MASPQEIFIIGLVALLVLSSAMGVLWLAWFVYRGGLHALVERRIARRKRTRTP